MSTPRSGPGLLAAALVALGCRAAVPGGPPDPGVTGGARAPQAGGFEDPAPPQAMIGPSHALVGARVMPMGDSITIGYGGVGGYRLPLWYEFWLLGRGSVDLVGSRTVGTPEAVPDREHEAHSGWRIRDFLDFAGDEDEPASSIEELLAASRPTILLLLVGTNDLWSPEDWHEAPDDLGRLLDRAHAFDPSLTVVVAQPLPTVHAGANRGVRWLADRFARVVHERWTAGHKVQLVDMRAACPILTTRDGVHPDAACYQAIACAWLEVLLDLERPILLPPDLPPLVPARAVDDEGALAPAELAVDGSGLADGLHAAERGTALAWRSRPVALAPNETGEALVEDRRPTLEFDLGSPHDLQLVELWNGRVEGGPAGRVAREGILRLGVATSEDGRIWDERGQWELIAPDPLERNPPEVRPVDWRGVRWVRFEVQSLQARLDPGTTGARAPAALSEVRFRGRIAPTAGPPAGAPPPR